MARSTFISNFLSSSNSSSSTLHLIHNHRPLSFTSTLSLLHSHSSSQKTILELPHKNYKNSRGLSAITKAGPSSTSYIFAFVFPISLLAVTIFTSMRIADELDQKFLEELAVNQEILEAEERDGDSIALEEKTTVPRKRNRPKREVEASSM